MKTLLCFCCLSCSACAMTIERGRIDFAGPHAVVEHVNSDGSRTTLTGGGMSQWGEAAIAAIAAVFTAHPFW